MWRTKKSDHHHQFPGGIVRIPAFRAKAYLHGGLLGPETSSFVGPTASQTILKYNVDVAVFSCKALSMTGGLCDSNEAETELKVLMQQQASKVVLLADHSKFDRIAFIRLFSFDKVDYIVTDQRPSEEWIEFLAKYQVSLLYPADS